MSTERPNISEKVKFWEEQDQINMVTLSQIACIEIFGQMAQKNV